MRAGAYYHTQSRFYSGAQSAVELKAIILLEDVHLAQALNYLKAYKLEVSLLINFGAKGLEFKRLILTNQSAKSINSQILGFRQP